MNDANSRSLEEILAAEREVERLSSEIAKGNVFRIMLSDNEKGSSGILLLLPNAEVLEHTHLDESEDYTFTDGHVETCSVGESHNLKNKTKELLVVYFKKHRVL